MAHLDRRRPRTTARGKPAATRWELFSRVADIATLVIGGHFSAGHFKRDVFYPGGVSGTDPAARRSPRLNFAAPCSMKHSSKGTTGAAKR
jgi:hypothetical protein